MDLPPRGAARADPSAVVRRATEFMRAHAGQPITMQQVAESAFVSTRGLHHAFVHELGEPPGASLRRLRLEGARADLLASDGAVTVAAVARRWGFAHASRLRAGLSRRVRRVPVGVARR